MIPPTGDGRKVAIGDEKINKVGVNITIHFG